MLTTRSLSMIAVLGMVCLPAGAQTYVGALSSDLDEIEGMGVWIDPGPTTIAWEITDMTTYYHYKYTFTVPSGANDISHYLIEVSPNFGADDFWNATGPFGGWEIGDFNQNNGNPSIPDEVHGLKFDDMWGTTAVIEFDSSRLPVWGDFYAKCGGVPPNEAWNEGLLAADPLDDPANGSIDNHILVPDGFVPEPATLSLLALAGLMMGRRQR